MSLGFKLKYDEMNEGNPVTSDNHSSKDGILKTEFYQTESHARNICFIKLEGERIFLSYSHLISCEYNPNDPAIFLHFTSHTIRLKGILLETLYYQLMEHHVKKLICSDFRYNNLSNEHQVIVNEILIEKKE